jgi:formate/nitrite transporter
MFANSSTTVAILLTFLLLADKSSSFQVPKPTSTLNSLDASYVDQSIAWTDVAEAFSKEEVGSNVYNQQSVVAMPPPADALDLSKISNILTPAQAYESLVQKGEYNAAASIPKTLFSSILGGCYVGMGAMVSLSIAGNSPGLAAADPGLQKFIFAALFPVNLLLALQCGGQLYTGNTATMMAALCEGRVNVDDLARSWSLSWMGNLIGCSTFAIACKFAGVLDGGAGHLAAVTLATKTSYELGPLFVKAMMCNWLVCLAVFLSMQAKDMGGKYLSIWLPVSTFVSIGFEHSVANMFLGTAGLLSSDDLVKDITIGTALTHNLIPVTIGNTLSGALFVGAAMSYMYGKLGEEELEVKR